MQSLFFRILAKVTNEFFSLVFTNSITKSLNILAKTPVSSILFRISLELFLDNIFLISSPILSFDTLSNILFYLQNYAIEKNYERIQILTKEKLQSFDSLEYKISFNLMKKFLL